MPRILLLILFPAALTVCRVAPPDTGPPVAEPASRSSFTKPISFSILEDYDKGDPLSQVAKDFALFKELGVPVWRGSFGWDDYEPEPGRFDFHWLRQFAALADSWDLPPSVSGIYAGVGRTARQGRPGLERPTTGPESMAPLRSKNRRRPGRAP